MTLQPVFHDTRWMMEEYGLRQREYNRKKNRYPIYSKRRARELIGVTLQEAIEQAKRLYPDLRLKATSGRMWTARGLIPSPSMESLGQGKGTKAHYPNDTPAQMAVVGYMMSLGYKQAQIAQARQIVLEGALVDNDLMHDVVSLLTLREETSNEGTATRLPSPEANELALAVQYYAKAIALARTGKTVDCLWPTHTHTQTDYDEEGNETFSFYVSLLGLYWDPRVDQKRLDPLAIDLDQRMKEKLELIRWKRKHDN